jgi:hypothetical protein
VTASYDKTARVWDAATGKALSEPMKHDDVVNSAQFSADGRRVVTASKDGTARVWDIPTITKKDDADDANLLADLAEAAGGLALQASGQTQILTMLTPDQVNATREKIGVKFPGRSKLTPLQRLMKWSVADRRNRTISPVSDLALAEWVENRIQEGTLDSLRAAMLVDPANARLTAHFGERLADSALGKETDPDVARRAGAEADTQTRRALKLAPENEEVKKLRAEVVKLLGGIVYEDFALGVDSNGPCGSVAQDPYWQSGTSLVYPDGRFIDSRKIPFIGLPLGIFARGRVKVGDYVIVFLTRSMGGNPLLSLET